MPSLVDAASEFRSARGIHRHCEQHPGERNKGLDPFRGSERELDAIRHPVDGDSGATEPVRTQIAEAGIDIVITPGDRSAVRRNVGRAGHKQPIHAVCPSYRADPCAKKRPLLGDHTLGTGSLDARCVRFCVHHRRPQLKLFRNRRLNEERRYPQVVDQPTGLLTMCSRNAAFLSLRYGALLAFWPSDREAGPGLLR